MNSKLQHRVNWSYQIGLLLIAICAVSSFFCISYLMASKTEFATLINVSGKQRMLSQRLALFSSQFEHASSEDTNCIKAELRSLRKQFAESHLRIFSECNDLRSACMETFLAEDGLNEQVAKFLTNVDLLIDAGSESERIDLVSEILEHSKHQLLGDLDEVVSILEQESLSFDRQMMKIEFLLLVLLLIGLLVEARFIFAPMCSLVTSTFHSLEKSKEKLAWASEHDSLTGLPNRRYVDRHLGQLGNIKSLNSTGLAVIHIDLDRFKAVNDSFGHAAGDHVLSVVGTRLQSIVSDGDVVARVGGDEFIVLLGSTSRKYEISNLAESIIETVSKPIKIGENSCSVGCSIGIGVSGPNSIQPKKLMLDADLALYESKGSGKGQYHFATPELTGKFRTLEEMRQRLSRALEERMFEPVFQPQIDPRQNCVVGVEALARWVGADGEFLPTGEFIELASELDLLDEVDRIIIEKSIRQLANWREDGLAVPRVGLNLCAAKLASCDLLEWLESTIACEGLDNSDVSIEVVESVLLDDNNAVLENIAKLQRRGFGIELDDFGSGHASINTLIDLSVDRIKIDRSLIQDIENKARPRIVVNSIAELAKQLGVSVLIEGVETDLQLEVINSLGEFVYQGYLFARPMKADMFELWFQSFSNDDESNSQNKPSRPCVTFSGMDNLSLSSEATGKEQ